MEILEFGKKKSNLYPGVLPFKTEYGGTHHAFKEGN